MPIEFRCAECASAFEVADDLAGKTIRCRECHGYGRVPKPQTPKAAPSPAVEAAMISVREKSVLPRWLPRKRWFWLSAGAIAVLILPACFWLVVFGMTKFERISRREPDRIDRNALLLAQEGEWKKAFAVIEDALTQEPDRVLHWMTRGELKMRYGSFGAAAQDYETVLRLDPTYEDARRLFAQARDKSEQARDKSERARANFLAQEYLEQLRRAEDSLREQQASHEEVKRAAQQAGGGEEWDRVLRNSSDHLRQTQGEIQRLRSQLDDCRRQASSP